MSTDIQYVDVCRNKEVQVSRLRLRVANTNHRLIILKRHLNDLCNKCQVKETIHHLLLECNKEDISELLRTECQL